MILFLTHTDLDAVGALTVARYFKIRAQEYMLVNYDELYNEDLQNKVLEFDKIIIVDLSIPEDLYKKFVELKKDYTIYDHHENSLNYKDDPNCFIDMGKCGTRIYFEQLSLNKRIPSVVSRFVHLIDVYDMWKKDHEDWEEAQNLNRVLRKKTHWGKKGIDMYDTFITSQLIKFDNTLRNYEFNIIENDYIDDEIYREKKEVFVANKMLKIRIDKKGNKFGLFTAGAKISQTCNTLLEQHDIQYVICINSYKGIDGKISIRSKGEFNCNQFKECGGHKNAGGGLFTKKFVLDLWDGKIQELEYNND